MHFVERRHFDDRPAAPRKRRTFDITLNQQGNQWRAAAIGNPELAAESQTRAGAVEALEQDIRHRKNLDSEHIVFVVKPHPEHTTS